MTFLDVLPAMALSLGFAGAASFAFAPFIRRQAEIHDVVDRPRGRHRHGRIVPMWGGLAPGIALLFAIGICAPWIRAWSPTVSSMQLWGFAIGVAVLLVGGAWDDARPLPPRLQILFPALAAALVVGSGTRAALVSHPLGGGFSLDWGTWLGVVWPADPLTFFWILVATYATKLQDGLDGLVTGLAAIGTGLVAALAGSSPFFQPGIAVLAAAASGSFLGFLPSNAAPAKQFLGESGSTVAGFALGVLAVLSGAKFAIALCVLAIPIADLGTVVVERLLAGRPWYEGDRSHLHFRLVAAGLSLRQAVGLYWGVSLGAGLLALALQTRGKLLLLAALVLFTVTASVFARRRAARLPSV